MHSKPVHGSHCITGGEFRCHLYQCSSDHQSPNLKMRARSATKKVILNTHMKLDMFSIGQI